MNEKIEQYYKLIYKVMNDLHCNREEEKQDDYFFHGLMGLYNGVKSYKPETKVKETIYYYVCIKNAIIVKFHSNSARKKTAIQEVSLETPICDSLTLKDILQSDLDLEEELIKQEQLECIYKVLNKMENTRYKQYIIDYYGIYNEPLNSYQIALKYGVSHQNISQSLKNGLKRLKKKVKREYEKSKKTDFKD